MKKCAHCQELKPLEEFPYNNRLLKHRHKHCRSCMSEFNKASYDKNPKAYRQNIYNNRKKRGEIARQYVWDYLSTHPCVECGESDPRLLEFDHIRGKKKAAVSVLATGRHSLETLKKEIDKCQVLCANCHRKKTYKERGWLSGKS